MLTKHPLLTFSVGSVSAMGTYSDSLQHVPKDVIETISQAPANWEDLEKALISMGVAMVSQLILVFVPKLFKKLTYVTSGKKIKTKPVEGDSGK